MIEASRFEAAAKDPSPFVIVLGERRSGKTELIKQRLHREYGSHNVVLVHSRDMTHCFDDVRDHIERFFTNSRDLRGNSGLGKNLYIDEFQLVPNIDDLSFLYGRWSSITMSSSLRDGHSLINFSRLNHFSIYDWYRPANIIHDCQSVQDQAKFRLMVGKWLV